MTEETRTFVKEKETKNTVKYEEEAPDGQPKIIGSLYVQKFFVTKEGTAADSVTVTVTPNFE